MQHTVPERIEQARSRWNVLEHAFYKRWSAGDLSPEELARYSGQYRHAVEAVATASAALADQLPDHLELREHAREEADHVALWDGFVDAVGGSPDAAANAETEACVAEWTRADSPLNTLARLYAVESGQPEISTTKLEGLSAHYGVETDAGTAYFTLHRGRDVEHAAEGIELLEELLAADPGAADGVVAAAEATFRANWKLLDGVG